MTGPNALQEVPRGRAGQRWSRCCRPDQICHAVGCGDQAGCGTTGSAGDCGHGVCKAPLKAFCLRILDPRGRPVCNPQVFISPLELSMTTSSPGNEK